MEDDFFVKDIVSFKGATIPEPFIVEGVAERVIWLRNMNGTYFTYQKNEVEHIQRLRCRCGVSRFCEC